VHRRGTISPRSLAGVPALGELLVAAVMVVGVAGVVVPVLPGLFLVWAAGIVWVWLDGALDQTVTVSYGEISARDYLWQLTVDLTVHAWDLARGIGADEQLEHELVRRIHAETEKDVDTLAASGRFEPPVHVPAHADLQARMLGLFGRRS
jgi:hypothetical protein